MTLLPEEKSLAEELTEIRRQIADLYGALDLRRSTISGGTFRLLSADGSLISSFGTLARDPLGNDVYGLMLLDSKGDIVLMVDENSEGFVYPHEFHQWIVPATQSISSGTFVNIAECQVVLTAQDVLTAQGVVSVPVGSTAEVRITTGGQTVNTDPVVVGEGSHTVMFEWLHPFTVGWGDSTSSIAEMLFHWEVRLASGAGPITAFPPRHLTFRNRRFVTGETVTGGGRVA